MRLGIEVAGVVDCYSIGESDEKAGSFLYLGPPECVRYSLGRHLTIAREFEQKAVMILVFHAASTRKSDISIETGKPAFCCFYYDDEIVLLSTKLYKFFGLVPIFRCSKASVDFG